MDELTPCPFCGSESGFIVKARASGRVEIHYGPDGKEIEVNTDKMEFIGYTDSPRCIDCLKLRRDLFVCWKGVISRG